jgi:DNA helicase-2/ATP-dependent DNA helicase PcrA
VAYLVEKGVEPEKIVLLTFTRRSAREMLTRASSLLDGRCNRVAGGTFHSYCLELLRRHAPLIGYPHNFNIVDATDAADVVDILRTARGYHQLDKRFPRKKAIYAMFSAATNRGQSLEEIVEAKFPQFLEFAHELGELRTSYGEYKRQYGLMDYDDLLLRTLELMESDDSLRRRVGAGCRHVLVDEYQDTNRLQSELVRHFASVHGNVMVVGDDAQSIYRFRGADFRNIFDFPQQFPGTRILKLEKNYRSTQPILDLANHLIEKASRKYEKHLFSDLPDGERPAVVPAPDDRYESRFVSQMVLELREQGVALSRMAVLFRSSFNSYDLEIELNRHNIPFVKFGGLKLSEAAHIKDIAAHLKVAENPMDAVAWNRILQLLDGIGPKTAHDMIEWVTSAEGDPFQVTERPFSPRYVGELTKLFEVLRKIRGGTMTLLEQVEALITYYEPILKRKYFEDYPKRLQDLEHFVALAGNFTERGDFLSSMALDPIELSALDTDPMNEDEAPLVLSTIHSAKGLEFHTVFIIHALDGVLPSGYSLKDRDAIDEELRLLYVAVTRAEENLFISYPILQYRRFDGQYLSNPSRFIAGVPDRLLEEMQLVEDAVPRALPKVSERRALPESVSGDGSGAEVTEPDDNEGLPF